GGDPMMPGPITLEDYMAREIKGWIPQKEEDHPRFLVGVVVKIATASSDWGDDVPVVEVAPDDDATIVWRVTAYASVLARELAKQRPAAGDRIGVKYAGMPNSNNDRAYHSFRVVVERQEAPAAAIDWDSIEKLARQDMEHAEIDDDVDGRDD